LPRLGSALNGDYLFWLADRTHYLYAPLDLSNGNLFSSPREIPIPSGRWKDNAVPSLGGGLTIEGVQDGTNPNPKPKPHHPSTLYFPPAITTEGGLDGTDPHGGGHKSRSPFPPPPAPGTQGVWPQEAALRAALWHVESNPECRSQVLAIPSRDLRSLILMRFTDGVTEVIRQTAVPSKVPDGFAAAVANLELGPLCR
ncbi:MAG TPA: hypothetical protein VFT43_06920, partial [Candidatus Polarisedimenticolia bacterium]|nr:hypothetical protein [Candidatus Polarisedimenticolia bacterium]